MSFRRARGALAQTMIEAVALKLIVILNDGNGAGLNRLLPRGPDIARLIGPPRNALVGYRIDKGLILVRLTR